MDWAEIGEAFGLFFGWLGLLVVLPPIFLYRFVKFLIK